MARLLDSERRTPVTLVVVIGATLQSACASWVFSAWVAQPATARVAVRASSILMGSPDWRRRRIHSTAAPHPRGMIMQAALVLGERHAHDGSPGRDHRDAGELRAPPRAGSAGPHLQAAQAADVARDDREAGGKRPPGPARADRAAGPARTGRIARRPGAGGPGDRPGGLPA